MPLPKFNRDVDGVPKLAFGSTEAMEASEAWGFNCGPSALAAAIGARPYVVRIMMPEFESRGYTNPTMLKKAMLRAGISYRTSFANCRKGEAGLGQVEHGLVRLQWDGPWMAPGVPVAAQYKHTHWVAVSLGMVFDINAIHGVSFDHQHVYIGWMPIKEYSEQFVVKLIEQCSPKSNGGWWATHGYDIIPQ